MNAEELGNQILALMAECNELGIEGSTTDENADPRLLEIGNLLTIFDVFHHAEYVEFATANFTFDGE